VSTGDVEITLSDGQGGVVVAPLSSVQAVIGWAPTGTPYQIVSTQNPATLQSVFTAGPLVEAASLVCAAGGTVLAVSVPLTAKGLASAVGYSSTNAYHTAGGTAALTLDGTNGAWDDNYLVVECVVAGTVGTGPGPSIQISVDAGRNFGPAISLGSATSYAIANSGITVGFTGAYAMAVGDAFYWQTIGPKWNLGAVQTALNTLGGSQYGIVGWGSTHLVGNDSSSTGGSGTTFTGGVDGASAATIETYADSLAAAYTYTRIMLAARDAAAPAQYGGSGETDATWYGNISNDYSAVSAKRIMACAGYYNTPSATGQNTSYGTPARRRSLAWATAARTATITPQVMQSRVSDGALSNIIVNPSSDPLDGFVYHNDGSNGPLDTARFCSARTRKGKPGYFVSHPNLMSPLGSQYNWWPKGAVIDIAAFLVHQLGDDFIDSDMRVNANGTLYINDVNKIQDHIGAGIDAVLLAQGWVSQATVVVVDQTANVAATSVVPLTVTVYGRGYVDEIAATLGFANALQA
jgi:hypothetical protein